MLTLYDEVIKDVISLVNGKELSIPSKNIEEVDKNEVLFKNDTAYELGGSSLQALGGMIVTSTEELANKDEIILVGKDIHEIKEDTSFARIAIVRVNEELMGTGNALYQKIRKIDYVKYHVFPKGYMLRISSMNEKEGARISKDAIKNKLSFSDIGKFFINKYHEIDAVESVKMIFITGNDFNYNELSKLLQKNENITKALDHLLNKVKMDCHTCNLQAICEEVEEKCKEDFKEQ